MSKRLVLIALGIIAGIVLSAHRVETKLSEEQMLVGDQVTLCVKVTAGSNDQIYFPSYSLDHPLDKGLEVLSQQIDTIKKDQSKILSCKYLVTSFDSSVYAIRPYVVVNNDTILSENTVGLKVNSVDVDTLHLDQFNGAFAPFESEFHWSYRLLALGLLLWLLMGIAFFIVVKLFRRKPTFKKVAITPPPPCHTIALEKIEKMKAEYEQSTLKALYMNLSLIVRQYVAQRFLIGALEMTTSELLRVLKKDLSEENSKRIANILTTSDLVKFAKYNSGIEEFTTMLTLAITVINSTKQEEFTTTEKIVEVSAIHQEKNRVRYKCLLGILILSSMSISFYLLNEIWACFF